MFKSKVLIAIIVLATLLRFIGLMPNIAHSDEGYLQDVSWGLINNIVTKGDFNPHSFKYGTWAYYLQAAVAAPVLGATYFSEVANTKISSSFASKSLDFNSFFGEAVRKYERTLVAFGRGETAVFGVASVFVLYLIGKKLFGEKIGLLSVLIFAIAPLHVRDSHYITTDILFVFFTLLAFLFSIDLIQKKRLRDFILTGFFVGFSLTIRYFPLALLAYPIAILFSFEKKKNWFLKVLVSGVFIPLGVFVGLPYLFLDPNGPTLLMQDLTKYALPWYSTSISNYAISIVTFLLSGGKQAMPQISMLYTTPDSFRFVHTGWILFNAYGLLPTLATLLGVVLMLFKSFKKFLLLIAIPLFNFIYISAFIPATYERLNIPMLPFMAVFAAFFLYHMYEKKGKLIFITILILIILQPLLKSSAASIACSKKTVQYQSVDWMAANILPSAKIGYVTMVSSPPTNYAKWFALEPGRDTSLEEALKNGLDHSFVNGARLDYISYPFFNKFIIPPAKLYENYYYSLVLSEYDSRAKLLGKLDKPWMCDIQRIYYYKLPEKSKEGTKVIKSDINNWQIKNVDETGKAVIDLKTKKYSQDSYQLVPPRIASENIPVEKDKTYTFSVWLKTDKNIDKLKLPSVVARLDYYSNSKSGKLKNDLRSISLLIKEGPTPMYFEKKRMQNKDVYFDTDYPGKIVALSPVTKINSNWQKITVTATAPEGVDFAVLSIQPISTDPATIYIDKASFLN